MRGSLYELPKVSISETLRLTPGIVDLWYFFSDKFKDPEQFASYNALMSPDERKRCAQLRFDRDRYTFAATRALVRSVLSNYSSVAPADWRFTSRFLGKPQISSPAGKPNLHFNLSHSSNLVVCAVSVAHERVGVDAERVDETIEVMEVAARHFSPFEVAALQRLPNCKQRKLFFEYWTLKESYLKACGIGLTSPLDRFSFVLDRQAVGIVFQDGPQDESRRWHFALLSADPYYQVAISVDTGGTGASFRAAHHVPLKGS